MLPQHSQINRRRPKQDLDVDEKSWLIDCLDRQDFTYTTPGKRDQVYIGKINGKKVYETKKWLSWTMNDFLDILNGCEFTGIQTEDSFMNEFGRKSSFRQLCELIKANKLHLQQKHSSCHLLMWNLILLKNSRVTPITKTIWTRNVTIANYGENCWKRSVRDRLNKIRWMETSRSRGTKSFCFYWWSRSLCTL